MLKHLNVLLLGVFMPFATSSALAGEGNVVEYYNESLDIYFTTIDGDEKGLLDDAASHPWQRTGKGFVARDAPGAGLVGVCRFFGTDRYRADGSRIGPPAHFYTADPTECAFVKTAWPSIAADGREYPAWEYEGVTYYVVAASSTGSCAAGTVPVHRLYNNGQGGKPNHRYLTEAADIAVVLERGWVDEGVVFCSKKGLDYAALVAVSPDHAVTGQSLPLSVAGHNLRKATGATFSPSVGLTLTNLTTTESTVTGTLAISPTAPTGRRLFWLNPGETTNDVWFTVAPANPAPGGLYVGTYTGTTDDGKAIEVTVDGTDTITALRFDQVFSIAGGRCTIAGVTTAVADPIRIAAGGSFNGITQAEVDSSSVYLLETAIVNGSVSGATIQGTFSANDYILLGCGYLSVGTGGGGFRFTASRSSAPPP